MVERDQRNPRVTLGLPVYNGEKYIAQAIESILHQSFTDFELIISDNASTDSTENICRPFAARDKRILYLRNDENRGAAYNFNRVCKIARGTYFKWAAHDDLLMPDFLEKCIAPLDTDPEAVLCCPQVQVIDKDGQPLGIYESDFNGLTDSRQSRRFAALLLGHDRATEIFGLIRREALEGTELHQPYGGSDSALLAELALRGRFARVAEPLFLNRDHPDRYVRAIYPEPWRQRAWYDPRTAGRASFPNWTRLTAYIRMVRRWVDEPSERRRCYGKIVRWVFRDWNFMRLAFDFVGALDPRIFTSARRLWQRVSGARRKDKRLTWLKSRPDVGETPGSEKR